MTVPPQRSGNIKNQRLNYMQTVSFNIALSNQNCEVFNIYSHKPFPNLYVTILFSELKNIVFTNRGIGYLSYNFSPSWIWRPNLFFRYRMLRPPQNKNKDPPMFPVCVWQFLTQTRRVFLQSPAIRVKEKQVFWIKENAGPPVESASRLSLTIQRFKIPSWRIFIFPQNPHYFLLPPSLIRPLCLALKSVSSFIIYLNLQNATSEVPSPFLIASSPSTLKILTWQTNQQRPSL